MTTRAALMAAPTSPTTLPMKSFSFFSSMLIGGFLSAGFGVRRERRFAPLRWNERWNRRGKSTRRSRCRGRCLQGGQDTSHRRASPRAERERSGHVRRAGIEHFFRFTAIVPVERELRQARARDGGLALVTHGLGREECLASAPLGVVNTPGVRIVRRKGVEDVRDVSLAVDPAQHAERILRRGQRARLAKRKERKRAQRGDEGPLAALRQLGHERFELRAALNGVARAPVLERHTRDPRKRLGLTPGVRFGGGELGGLLEQGDRLGVEALERTDQSLSEGNLETRAWREAFPKRLRLAKEVVGAPDVAFDEGKAAARVRELMLPGCDVRCAPC